MSAIRRERQPVPRGAAGVDSAEGGFTLVEALVAITILVFGLIAVTNLLLVAAQSNSIAHASTGAAAQASEVLERLKAIPFKTLTPGGDMDADAGIANCDDATQAGGCVVAGNFNSRRGMPGLGEIKSRWTIVVVDATTLFIEVRSEGTSPLVARMSQARFTTFRSCTEAETCS
jgi:hypothetical protein